MGLDAIELVLLRSCFGGCFGAILKRRDLVEIGLLQISKM
jgi:hypothetical protein